MGIEAFNNLPQEKRDSIIRAGLLEFTGKSYSDAGTDAITKLCKISKGILFHYFSSKKNFYLFLLEHSMNLLTVQSDIPEAASFYQLIFESMNRKLELYQRYPLEIHFVNTAAKEASRQISSEKNSLFARYMTGVQRHSFLVIHEAVQLLELNSDISSTALEKALTMYINTIITGYLEQYKDCPELFFQNAVTIQSEIREYLDLFLRGNVKEDTL